MSGSSKPLRAHGRLDRAVEGIAGNEELFRRASEGQGLTRPELAVLLSTAKLAAQDGVEEAPLALDASMESELLAAFPAAMVEKHKAAILAHRLRKEIIATKLANRMVNRLGSAPSVRTGGGGGLQPGRCRRCLRNCRADL